jgi:hypothetical protein
MKNIMPTNILEVLQNVKTALDANLFFEDGFYQPERIQEFFGADHFEGFKPLGVPAGHFERASLTGFESIICPVLIGETFFQGFSVTIDKKYAAKLSEIPKSENEVREVIIRFSCLATADGERNQSLIFENVIGIFGAGWSRDKGMRPPTRTFAPSTHEMGNEKIQYSWNTETHNKVLDLEFGHDGTLSSGYLKLSLI